MASSSSSYSLLFLTLFIFSAISAVTSCPPSDRAALLAFKDALTEPNLGIFHNWTGNDCCQGWYGLSCDPNTHRVTDINLRGESQDRIFQKLQLTGYMTGNISPEICKLTGLSTLVLADWKGISGEIPSCIASSLSSLRILDLTGNQISGEIPADIGKLRRLTVFSLGDNAISSEIPKSLVNLAGLKHLDLSNNRISGNLPWNFGNLRMLSRALLSRNELTGSIPKSVFKMNRLADLDLSMNRITGSIPVQLGKMKVLSTLKLDGNSMSGQIPSRLLSNSGMGILNLSRNGFEGPIPDVFGAKTYFMALDLSYNNLTGKIPGSLSSARFMGHLDLSHNHLCGTIPVGSPFDHLDAASFSDNDCLCGNPLKSCE
ncbi:hypothetical protein PIB30_006404 [Stylosanthes scabra]|uniref:Leucine-rich repeat-containing N-terminal plant-type domain-containing protein n=1 Tax=Stylosanthes scabra TaxID=79078 RepID=A0ABU6T412_9FABA|nr:hypothetical protein [Stylosanthes scabra]